MKKKTVYCAHNWEEYGKKEYQVERCLICGELWKKLEQSNPPQFIIGYVEED